MFVTLDLPPGMVRNGTVQQAKGRWYDGNLVRWHGGALKATGGWAQYTEKIVADSKPVVGLYAWQTDLYPRIAIGSRTKLSVIPVTPTTKVASDVTPAGFVAGAADGTGGGLYQRVDADTWDIDNFGEDMVACMASDGRILYYDSSTYSTGAIAALTNAPTGCSGVFVTAERFVVALGAGGDKRLVSWCDQEAPTVWASTITNQAGDLPLASTGRIMAGRRSKQESLIWTDNELFGMRYIGGSLVYSFPLLGSACGAISKRSMAIVDGRAMWMGSQGFYVYDGFVKPIECPLADYVFGRLNRSQASKVVADVRSDFNEIWWYYPAAAGASAEPDSYIKYNYLLGAWDTGAINRTAGIDRGVFDFPLAGDSYGYTYAHEYGTDYLDASVGAEAQVPYITSGPLELGGGDNVFSVLGYIPDENTLGYVNLTLLHRLYPTASDTTSGPYSAANPTSIRITAREVRAKFTQVTAGWRVGAPKLDVRPGGER